MPVVATGNTVTDNPGTLSSLALDPAKHYYISVLPTTPGTYSIGGAAIPVGENAVTVILNKLPLHV
jgi:hypothetical protein